MSIIIKSGASSNLANVSAAGAIQVDSSGVTQPVSAASLPLPAGASTSAKQPALGTAGVSAADVLSVQGILSMTPLKVDGSGVTQPVTQAAGSSISIGSSSGKAIVMKTGSLVTTAVTADQVVLTYTVTAGKTFYLEYVMLSGRFTVISATATILGNISLETPSGTKVITDAIVNPTTSDGFQRIIIPFAEPIPVAAAVAIRVVVTPAAVTSMTWFGNFGGYEK